jgi:hypothetical protein
MECSRGPEFSPEVGRSLRGSLEAADNSRRANAVTQKIPTVFHLIA